MKGMQTPLHGVKVLDFAWALVGSLTTKLLADHGAQVVKVESALRPCLSRLDKQIDASRRDNLDDKPWFSHFNTSKLSLQLNMKHPRMREIIDPLIDWADVVVENFSPGTMAKLGLDYDSIRRRRPDIIMVSGSVFGQTGPYAQSWGVDGTGAALSSRMVMTGWPDRNPVTPSVPYGDVVLPYFMGAAVAAALERKRETGEGEYIDASMYEVCVQQMSPAILAAQTGDNAPTRRGNRSADTLLQGVFPCKQKPCKQEPCKQEPCRADGGSQWIGISIFNAAEWQRFVECLPGDEWPDAHSLAAMPGRQLDELDKRIGQWTAQQERYDLMARLQQLGIAAGVVQDIADTFERDPQLQHRNYLKKLQHPYLGEFGHQTPPVKLSRTPADVQLAPNMGQHTEYVCRDILGMSAETFKGLQDEKLFT